MTRTTVDIDDELLACVMRRYGLLRSEPLSTSRCEALLSSP